MPCDFSKAKEPELDGTLDGTSPSGTEAPTGATPSRSDGTRISKGYRDRQVTSSLQRDM
jgi:hypothetical protein